jgi:putative heme-binding domain-containing protein
MAVTSTPASFAEMLACRSLEGASDCIDFACPSGSRGTRMAPVGIPLICRPVRNAKRMSELRIPFRSGPSWIALAIACVLGVPESRAPVPAADGVGQLPRPVAIWPSGPLDVVVTFPNPVTPELATSLVGQSITYRDPRHEVSGQQASPQPGTLAIAGARLIDSNRTLILATDPHPRPDRYRLRLGRDPGCIESDYDLSGVDVAWSKADDKDNAGSDPDWQGWWPGLDLDAVRRATRGSTPHERGFERLGEPGRLVVSAQVILPPGEVQVRLESTSPVSEAALGDEQASERGEFTFRSRGEALFLTFTLETGPQGRPTSLRVVYRVGKEGPFRAIERDRIFLPWAPLASGRTTEPAPASRPDLVGGDARRGAELFFGDQAKCSQCHAIGGRGGTVGPDLTEIHRKGMEHVYQSIAAPSAEIAPDYVPFTVAARDGRVLAGLVKAEGADSIRVTDTNAKSSILRRDEIDQIRPSATSIMPVGLAAAIGQGGLRDLMAYLISEKAPRPQAGR